MGKQQTVVFAFHWRDRKPGDRARLDAGLARSLIDAGVARPAPKAKPARRKAKG